MSLTETQIHAKRHERTLSQRCKAKHKSLKHGRAAQSKAWSARNHASWLSDVFDSQQRATMEQEERHEQAQESRRAKAAMSRHGKKGLLNRVKSFFGRGG